MVRDLVRDAAEKQALQITEAPGPHDDTVDAFVTDGGGFSDGGVMFPLIDPSLGVRCGPPIERFRRHRNAATIPYRRPAIGC